MSRSSPLASRRWAALAIGLAVALSLPVAAQDYQAAARHFAAAQQAYAKKKFVVAADEFEQAYLITRDPLLLYNVGESYDKAANGKGAVRYYRQYLTELPAATDRPKVEARIGELEKKYKLAPGAPLPAAPGAWPPTVPAIPAPAAGTPSSAPAAPVVAPPPIAATPSPAVAPPGATAAPPPVAPPPPTVVAPAPAAPVAPAPLQAVAPSGAPSAPPSAPPPSTTPGQPAATPPAPTGAAAATGAPAEAKPAEAKPAEAQPEATKPTEAKPAEATAEETKPVEAKAAEPAPAPPGGGLLDEGKLSKLRVVAWVGVAATVALVTAGAIFGLAAQSRSDEVGRRERQLDPAMQPPEFNAQTESEVKALYADGRAFDIAGISLLTAAGVAAVISGVLFFVDHRNQTKSAPRQARTLIAPVVGAQQVGATLRWEF